jgi:hypothetical protein
MPNHESSGSDPASKNSRERSPWTCAFGRNTSRLSNVNVIAPQKMITAMTMAIFTRLDADRTRPIP